MSKISVYFFWAVFTAVVLTILKLTGYFVLPWLWVLSPVWIYVALVAFVILVILTLTLITLGSAGLAIRRSRNARKQHEQGTI